MGTSEVSQAFLTPCTQPESGSQRSSSQQEPVRDKECSRILLHVKDEASECMGVTFGPKPCVRPQSDPVLVEADALPPDVHKSVQKGIIGCSVPPQSYQSDNQQRQCGGD